ncbi:DNA helicase [Acuticoccus kandeliae]|uniref:DNA helicase n=1 Tax=Acuticoccus kandeliae TaxID=2073160 RepID=UPI000D3E8E44|nr:DNA helicase [Acuticoccus kandeliae]
MPVSAPIHRLKRNARRLARETGLPLHAALDRIAAGEGFATWSLLIAKVATPERAIYGRLRPADLLLLGARPGQGKTLTGLKLAAEAMAAGHAGAFFTLEYSERDVHERLSALGIDAAAYGGRFLIDTSEAVGAAHIMARLHDAPPGTVAVIDYLQILDLRRTAPDLSTQVAALKAFARERGLILVFLSQIDRTFDPARKPCPDLGDVRLPNPLDLALFDKTCFLHGREMRFHG